MANEFKHKSQGGILDQAEYENIDAHIFNSQATGDSIEASSSTQLSRRKNNISASSSPGVGDDTGDGYKVGSMWLNLTADKAYICLDISSGAAVWTEITLGEGAPAAVNYLVGTANATLSAEIVVGTTPGGELGGSWASPTVDGTHSGSAHHTRYADSEAISAIQGEATLDLTGRLSFDKGANIASASTVTPGTDGNYFDITGTTDITAIASLRAGTVVVFQFDGAVVVTHNSTTLILQGATNLTTAAGDVVAFISEGSGNWRELSRRLAAAGGGSGAATALDNLASVAINVSLVSDTDSTDDLGTSSIGWKDLYIDGVVFPATQVANAGANTLDDYEEGTFVPQLSDQNNDGSGESQTYTAQTGHYTKIGRQVFYQLHLEINSLGTLTTSQECRIQGLPFTSANIANVSGSATVALANSLALPTASESLAGYVPQNSTRIALTIWEATAGTNNLTVGEFSAGGLIRVNGHYRI